jgi:hypothetical protein
MSDSRRARREAALAAQQGPAPEQAEEGQEPPVERPLKAVPAPPPEPPAVPKPAKLNFLLPPSGLMGTRLSVETKKSVKVPGPLNAHLIAFQSEFQGPRYKVQNGSIALWRALLQERHQMVQEALAEQARTGTPVTPRMGPVQRAFEEQLDLMAAEKSGDIFDD